MIPSRHFLVRQAVLNAAVSRHELTNAAAISFVPGGFRRAIIAEFYKLVARHNAWDEIPNGVIRL